MTVEYWWNDTGLDSSSARETCHSASLVATNVTWTEVGSNLDVHGERQATDRLACGKRNWTHWHLSHYTAGQTLSLQEKQMTASTTQILRYAILPNSFSTSGVRSISTGPRWSMRMVADPGWPPGLRRGSAVARLLGWRVRIPPRGSECRVLSGRGLCVVLITRPEESYRL